MKVRLHSAGAASRLAALLLPQNIPDILGRRALPAGRIASLGATSDFHHGLLTKRAALVTLLQNHVGQIVSAHWQHAFVERFVGSAQ